MPIYRPGKFPKTGITWVDALLKAMHEDPTSAQPTPFGVPLKLVPKTAFSASLIEWLREAIPGLHKAAQRAPDIAVTYPSELFPLGGGGWSSTRRQIELGPGNPQGNFVHELLHALYGGKTKSKLSSRQFPKPKAAREIAEWFGDIIDPDLGDFLEMNYPPSHYWGEAALEALTENIMRKAKEVPFTPAPITPTVLTGFK